MPDLSFADVEAKLRKAGKEKQALGALAFEVANSRWHQRAAEKEAAVYHWTPKARQFLLDNTDLSGEALAHAVYVLAGFYRETVQQAIAECEVAFLEERRAGQR